MVSILHNIDPHCLILINTVTHCSLLSELCVSLYNVKVFSTMWRSLFCIALALVLQSELQLEIWRWHCCWLQLWCADLWFQVRKTVCLFWIVNEDFTFPQPYPVVFAMEFSGLQILSFPYLVHFKVWSSHNKVLRDYCRMHILAMSVNEKWCLKA